MIRNYAVFVLGLLVPVACIARQEPLEDSGRSRSDTQGKAHQDMKDMREMKMESESREEPPKTFIEEIMLRGASGTSAEPNSTPLPMLMTMTGKWMLMFHANIFVLDQQQSGARGGDKFFSTNWFMGTAQHKLGPGTFTGRLMLSLEPATISQRRYPLLFQQGETAFGKPIEDGQHPHDFIMELAALYDLKMGENNLLSLYFAPVGDPAIGPTAYAHRASASENPLATLGHHQQDSTHIANEVVTVGLTHGMLRIEGSGFHGREPDEFRWDIDTGKIDSWSTRLTVQPGKNWSGQVSYARITSVEALFPNEDQARLTASVMYNRRLHDGTGRARCCGGARGRFKTTPSLTAIFWNPPCASAPAIPYGLVSKMRIAPMNWCRVETRFDLVFGRVSLDACRCTASATIAISISFRIWDPPWERNSPRTGSPGPCSPFMARAPWDLPCLLDCDPFRQRPDSGV